MKLNISNPLNNVQKSVEVDDDKKLLPFFEKRIGSEVPADSIGEEFAGYVFKITGGNDKQGFPMLQGVLTNGRVRLLLREGMKCYKPRRKGERKRKSVRGCIVGHDISALNVVMVQKGKNEIPGLTDKTVGKKLGPKRANKIRKLFNLEKDDDVRKYVIGRVIKKGSKTKIIKPKIQRLITEKRLARRERLRNNKKKVLAEKRAVRRQYKVVLAKFNEEMKSKRTDESKKVSKSKRLIQKKLKKGKAAGKGKVKGKEKGKDKVKQKKIQKTKETKQGQVKDQQQKKDQVKPKQEKKPVKSQDKEQKKGPEKDTAKTSAKKQQAAKPKEDKKKQKK